eukprot:g1304.t1
MSTLTATLEKPRQEGHYLDGTTSRMKRLGIMTRGDDGSGEENDEDEEGQQEDQDDAAEGDVEDVDATAAQGGGSGSHGAAARPGAAPGRPLTKEEMKQRQLMLFKNWPYEAREKVLDKVFQTIPDKIAKILQSMYHVNFDRAIWDQNAARDVVNGKSSSGRGDDTGIKIMLKMDFHEYVLQNSELLDTWIQENLEEVRATLTVGGGGGGGDPQSGRFTGRQERAKKERARREARRKRAAGAAGASSPNNGEDDFDDDELEEDLELDTQEGQLELLTSTGPRKAPPKNHLPLTHLPPGPAIETEMRHLLTWLGDVFEPPDVITNVLQDAEISRLGTVTFLPVQVYNWALPLALEIHELRVPLDHCVSAFYAFKSDLQTITNAKAYQTLGGKLAAGILQGKIQNTLNDNKLVEKVLMPYLRHVASPLLQREHSLVEEQMLRRAAAVAAGGAGGGRGSEDETLLGEFELFVGKDDQAEGIRFFRDELRLRALDEELVRFLVVARDVLLPTVLQKGINDPQIKAVELAVEHWQALNAANAAKGDKMFVVEDVHAAARLPVEHVNYESVNKMMAKIEQESEKNSKKRKTPTEIQSSGGAVSGKDKESAAPARVKRAAKKDLQDKKNGKRGATDSDDDEIERQRRSEDVRNELASEFKGRERRNAVRIGSVDARFKAEGDRTSPQVAWARDTYSAQSGLEIWAAMQVAPLPHEDQEFLDPKAHPFSSLLEMQERKDAMPAPSDENALALVFMQSVDSEPDDGLQQTGINKMLNRPPQARTFFLDYTTSTDYFSLDKNGGYPSRPDLVDESRKLFHEDGFAQLMAKRLEYLHVPTTSKDYPVKYRYDRIPFTPVAGKLQLGWVEQFCELEANPAKTPLVVLENDLSGLGTTQEVRELMYGGKLVVRLANMRLGTERSSANQDNADALPCRDFEFSARTEAVAAAKELESGGYSYKELDVNHLLRYPAQPSRAVLRKIDLKTAQLNRRARANAQGAYYSHGVGAGRSNRRSRKDQRAKWQVRKALRQTTNGDTEMTLAPSTAGIAAAASRGVTPQERALEKKLLLSETVPGEAVEFRERIRQSCARLDARISAEKEAAAQQKTNERMPGGTGSGIMQKKLQVVCTWFVQRFVPKKRKKSLWRRMLSRRNKKGKISEYDLVPPRKAYTRAEQRPTVKIHLSDLLAWFYPELVAPTKFRALLSREDDELDAPIAAVKKLEDMWDAPDADVQDASDRRFDLSVPSKPEVDTVSVFMQQPASLSHILQKPPVAGDGERAEKSGAGEAPAAQEEVVQPTADPVDDSLSPKGPHREGKAEKQQNPAAAGQAAAEQPEQPEPPGLSDAGSRFEKKKLVRPRKASSSKPGSRSSSKYATPYFFVGGTTAHVTNLKAFVELVAQEFAFGFGDLTLSDKLLGKLDDTLRWYWRQLAPKTAGKFQLMEIAEVQFGLSCSVWTNDFDVLAGMGMEKLARGIVADRDFYITRQQQVENYLHHMIHSERSRMRQLLLLPDSNLMIVGTSFAPMRVKLEEQAEEMHKGLLPSAFRLWYFKLSTGNMLDSDGSWDSALNQYGPRRVGTSFVDKKAKLSKKEAAQRETTALRDILTGCFLTLKDLSSNAATASFSAYPSYERHAGLASAFKKVRALSLNPVWRESVGLEPFPRAALSAEERHIASRFGAQLERSGTLAAKAFKSKAFTMKGQGAGGGQSGALMFRTQALMIKTMEGGDLESMQIMIPKLATHLEKIRDEKSHLVSDELLLDAYAQEEAGAPGNTEGDRKFEAIKGKTEPRVFSPIADSTFLGVPLGMFWANGREWVILRMANQDVGDPIIEGMMNCKEKKLCEKMVFDMKGRLSRRKTAWHGAGMNFEENIISASVNASLTVKREMDWALRFCRDTDKEGCAVEDEAFAAASSAGSGKMAEAGGNKGTGEGDEQGEEEDEDGRAFYGKNVDFSGGGGGGGGGAQRPQVMTLSAANLAQHNAAMEKKKKKVKDDDENSDDGGSESGFLQKRRVQEQLFSKPNDDDDSHSDAGSNTEDEEKQERQQKKGSDDDDEDDDDDNGEKNKKEQPKKADGDDDDDEDEDKKKKNGKNKPEEKSLSPPSGGAAPGAAAAPPAGVVQPEMLDQSNKVTENKPKPRPKTVGSLEKSIPRAKALPRKPRGLWEYRERLSKWSERWFEILKNDGAYLADAYLIDYSLIGQLNQHNWVRTDSANYIEELIGPIFDEAKRTVNTRDVMVRFSVKREDATGKKIRPPDMATYAPGPGLPKRAVREADRLAMEAAMGGAGGGAQAAGAKAKAKPKPKAAADDDDDASDTASEAGDADAFLELHEHMFEQFRKTKQHQAFANNPSANYTFAGLSDVTFDLEDKHLQERTRGGNFNRYAKLIAAAEFLVPRVTVNPASVAIIDFLGNWIFKVKPHRQVRAAWTIAFGEKIPIKALLADMIPPPNFSRRFLNMFTLKTITISHPYEKRKSSEKELKILEIFGVPMIPWDYLLFTPEDAGGPSAPAPAPKASEDGSPIIQPPPPPPTWQNLWIERDNPLKRGRRRLGLFQKLKKIWSYRNVDWRKAKQWAAKKKEAEAAAAKAAEGGGKGKKGGKKPAAKKKTDDDDDDEDDDEDGGSKKDAAKAEEKPEKKGGMLTKFFGGGSKKKDTKKHKSGDDDDDDEDGGGSEKKKAEEKKGFFGGLFGKKKKNEEEEKEKEEPRDEREKPSPPSAPPAPAAPSPPRPRPTAAPAVAAGSETGGTSAPGTSAAAGTPQTTMDMGNMGQQPMMMPGQQMGMGQMAGTMGGMGMGQLHPMAGGPMGMGQIGMGQQPMVAGQMGMMGQPQMVPQMMAQQPQILPQMMMAPQPQMQQMGQPAPMMNGAMGMPMQLQHQQNAVADATRQVQEQMKQLQDAQQALREQETARRQQELEAQLAESNRRLAAQAQHYDPHPGSDYYGSYPAYPPPGGGAGGGYSYWNPEGGSGWHQPGDYYPYNYLHQGGYDAGSYDYGGATYILFLSEKTSKMSRYCVELCQKFQVSSVHQLTWYHSCNSKAKLAKALRSDVHLIEADVTLGDYEATEGDAHIGWSSSSVVVGTSPAASSSAPRMQHPAPRRANRRDREGEGESSALAALGRGLAQAEDAENGNRAPAVQVVDVCTTTTTTKAGSCAVIMAHPPSRRSNLTLEQFIRRVCQYNCAVEPDLAKTRQTEVIHNLNQNTTLLEGVAIPITNVNGDVSGLLLGPPPGNRSYEDLDPFIREILEESESTASELEKTASDGSLSGSDFLHTPKSSNGSVVGGADYLVRGTTSKADRRMNAELQEHLGVHTVVKKTKRRPKGIKLDFKDMAAVKPAIDLLMKMNVWAQVVCVWLNADIAAGPGCLPLQDNWILDGRKFLQRCCRVPDVVLSLGWISSELSPGGRYTQRMVNDMLELVQRPFLRGADSFLYTPAKIAHHITFCVQARYALASTEVLKELLELVPSSSLTVYTGTATFGITPDDLQAIEENFDTTRLFVDVWTRTQKSSKGKIMKSSLGTERCSVM